MWSDSPSCSCIFLLFVYLPLQFHVGLVADGIAVVARRSVRMCALALHAIYGVGTNPSMLLPDL